MLRRENLLQFLLLRGGRCINRVVRRLPKPALIRASGAFTLAARRLDRAQTEGVKRVGVFIVLIPFPS
jgi:hypothetical protein